MIIPLNREAIRKQCLKYMPDQTIAIYLFDSIGSTNQYLKHLPPSTHIDLCCAETQTNGRGRLGRTWHSPFGENIYCSIRCNIPMPISQYPALSLIIGLAILSGLQSLEINQDIRIKWPNDLLWQGKKLAGILIESHTEATHNQCIIGFGLNVNSHTAEKDVQEQLDRPWCSLFEITGKNWNRNEIIGILLAHIHRHIQRYFHEGLIPFISIWNEVDALYGQATRIQNTRGEILEGTAHGINEKGQLLIYDKMNVLHEVASGEATLN